MNKSNYLTWHPEINHWLCTFSKLLTSTDFVWNPKRFNIRQHFCYFMATIETEKDLNYIRVWAHTKPNVMACILAHTSPNWARRKKGQMIWYKLRLWVWVIPRSIDRSMMMNPFVFENLTPYVSWSAVFIVKDVSSEFIGFHQWKADDKSLLQQFLL